MIFDVSTGLQITFKGLDVHSLYSILIISTIAVGVYIEHPDHSSDLFVEMREESVTVGQSPVIDSLINQYTDIRKWFVKAHTEEEIDSINRVIQEMKSIPWIERLAGKKIAISILLDMQKKAARECDRYLKDIAQQKKLFRNMNPGLYDETATQVLYYDYGRKFVFLPLGEISFADEAIEYIVGSPPPRQSYFKHPANALTPPGIKHEQKYGFGATSLGTGGSLTLEFTDNALIDINGPDLYIFESFDLMEPIYLEISNDGYQWIDLGILRGWETGIDIHDFVEEGDVFHFVRITDEGEERRDPAGADIDAIAAIGSALRTTLHVSVLFDSNDFIPKKGAEFKLTELAQSIQKFEKASINITGHTDSVGDEEYNFQLSRKRVAEITHILQSNLYGGDYTWTETSVGELQPVADNETVEGRAMNRRVEVLVQPLK